MPDTYIKTTRRRKVRNLPSTKGKPQDWQLAIEYARQLLVKNKMPAARLRAAIRSFEGNMAQGVPFPGMEGLIRSKRPNNRVAAI
jgi:hypothetical protein